MWEQKIPKIFEIGFNIFFSFKKYVRRTRGISLTLLLKGWSRKYENFPKKSKTLAFFNIDTICLNFVHLVCWAGFGFNFNGVCPDIRHCLTQTHHDTGLCLQRLMTAPDLLRILVEQRRLRDAYVLFFKKLSEFFCF